MIPDRPHLVRDGAKIAPDVQFWCYPLGTCTAVEIPDEHGLFRGSYVQHLADGRPQVVTVAWFHVDMVIRGAVLS